MLRARLVDAALGLACAGGAVLEISHHGSDGIHAGPHWLNVLVLGVVGLLVGGWRVAPGPALVAMSLTLLVPSLFLLHDVFFWSTILPLALVAFRAARHDDGLLARWGWVLAVGALFSDAVRYTEVGTDTATAVIVLGGAALVGRIARRSEQQRDRLDRTVAELAEAQTAREQTAAQSERNRIAAELHDLVAHAVGEMVLQLGAARLGLQSEQVAVPSQLTAAETTGRQALAELRQSLTVLPDHPDHGLSPVPGLAAVPDLLDRFGTAGLDLHLRASPGLDDLPPGLQLSVHRVLQESLTNVLKHAGPVRTEVELARTRDTVVLEVRNATGESVRTALPSGRHGLIGMRERLSVYGGTLDAGPDGSSGWRVRACWPLLEVRPSAPPSAPPPARPVGAVP